MDIISRPLATRTVEKDPVYFLNGSNKSKLFLQYFTPSWYTGARLSQVIFLSEFSISLTKFLTTEAPWLISLPTAALFNVYLHFLRIRSVGLTYCPNFQAIFSRF